MAEKAQSTLVTHCGARAVTRDELDRIEAPPATATWFPVKHSTALGALGAALTAAGFAVRDTKIAVARGDARLFATLDLESVLASGVTLAVGVRNSTDKSLPLGFVAGSRVFVCDNLAFRSELTVKRKHTRHGEARFAEAISLAVKTLVEFREHEAARVERYQQTDLDDRAAEALMLRSFERGLVSHRVLPGVIREWRSPSYPAFEAMNAWRLLNAFTTVLADRQKSNPQAHAAQTMALGGFLDEHLGIRPFVPASGEAAANGQAS